MTFLINYVNIDGFHNVKKYPVGQFSSFNLNVVNLPHRKMWLVTYLQVEKT